MSSSAAAHQAGQLDWRGLAAAYDQVREWSKTDGLSFFVERWPGWPSTVNHTRSSRSPPWFMS